MSIFCPRPWQALSVDEAGYVYVCARLPALGHLRESLQALYSKALLTRMKEQFLAGQAPPECQAVLCPQLAE